MYGKAGKVDADRITISTDISTKNVEETKRVDAEVERVVSFMKGMRGKIVEILAEVTAMNNEKQRISHTIEHVLALSTNSSAATQEVSATINEQTTYTANIAQAAEQLKDTAHQLENAISNFKMN